MKGGRGSEKVKIKFHFRKIDSWRITKRKRVKKTLVSHFHFGFSLFFSIFFLLFYFSLFFLFNSNLLSYTEIDERERRKGEIKNRIVRIVILF